MAIVAETIAVERDTCERENTSLVQSKSTSLGKTYENGRKKHTHITKESKKKIIEGLKAFKPIYIIAEDVGVCRQTLYKYLREKMGERYKDMKESMIDVAENRLFKNILDGNQNAIQFFLDRQGKHRGYGEKPQKDREDVPIINIGKIEIGESVSTPLKESVHETIEAVVEEV